MKVSLLVLCFSALVLGGTERYRRTPYGWIHPDCVHQIPSGSNIEELPNGRTVVDYPDGVRRELPNCAHREDVHVITLSQRTDWATRAQHLRRRPHQSQDLVAHGWQAYTTYQYPKSLVWRSGQNTLGILYIFTGLQNINWIPEPKNPPPSQPFDIIQPVLEYTGGSWTVASWYVTLEQGYVESTPIPVNAGQSIYGNMTQLSSAGAWYIGSTVTQTGKTTQITKHILVSQPWAYTALEVYSVSNCKQYPDNSIDFTGMTIADNNGKPLTPQWVTHIGQEPACKEHAVVNDPSSVTILFGNEGKA